MEPRTALTMTNDEAQEWLLAQHNAAPGPPDPARFGAAIRAIRAKAIADAKEWYGLEAEASQPAPESLDAATLARRIIASDWWSRSEGYQRRDGTWTPDQSSCSMCDAHGGYRDYSVEWHEAECPVRWACGVLGTTDALGKANEVRDELDAARLSAKAGE